MIRKRDGGGQSLQVEDQHEKNIREHRLRVKNLMKEEDEKDQNKLPELSHEFKVTLPFLK